MARSVYRISYHGAVGLHDLYYGSLRNAGRWHTPAAGATRAVVYAAGTRALAQLEKLVHCNGFDSVDLALLRLEIADGAELLDVGRDLGLKRSWRLDEGHTQELGNAWFHERASLGLWVPSFVEPRERNLLLNPTHAHYETHVRVVVEERRFRFDPRPV